MGWTVQYIKKSTEAAFAIKVKYVTFLKMFVSALSLSYFYTTANKAFEELYRAYFVGLLVGLTVQQRYNDANFYISSCENYKVQSAILVNVDIYHCF